jgi:hypothetical protein
MIAVRNDAYAVTDGKQVPWESSSLRSQFFFRQSGGVVSETDTAPANPISVKPDFSAKAVPADNPAPSKADRLAAPGVATYVDKQFLTSKPIPPEGDPQSDSTKQQRCEHVHGLRRRQAPTCAGAGR